MGNGITDTPASLTTRGNFKLSNAYIEEMANAFLEWELATRAAIGCRDSLSNYEIANLTGLRVRDTMEISNRALNKIREAWKTQM